MCCCTYFPDEYLKQMDEKLREGDPEMYRLLDQVRIATEPSWWIERKKLRRKRLLHTETRLLYSVYFHIKHTEYQVVNLLTEGGEGSIFTAGSTRSEVMNFLMGLRNGADMITSRQALRSTP